MEKIPNSPQINVESMVTTVMWPIIRLQMWGFSVFNILLAYGLFMIHSQVPFIVANNDAMLRAWAVFYLIVAIITMATLKTGNTRYLRRITILVVFARSTWLAALLLRVFLGGSILLAALWGIILFIELTNYIFLLKKQKHYEHPRN